MARLPARTAWDSTHLPGPRVHRIEEHVSEVNEVILHDLVGTTWHGYISYRWEQSREVLAKSSQLLSAHAASDSQGYHDRRILTKIQHFSFIVLEAMVLENAPP